MTEKLSVVLGVERMNEEKIKVVYSDGEPIVYRDDNRLNEKEIVDLLVEYFEDCDALIKENEELKKVLGAILLEVKRDISNRGQTGEITVFINPNSFNLISELLRKYEALKEWYE